VSNLKENLEQLIDNIKDGNYNGAETMFNQILQDKMHDRLEAEKIAVAGSIFNEYDEDLALEEAAKKHKKVDEDEDEMEDDEDEMEDDEDEMEDDEDEDEEDDEEEVEEKKHKGKK